MNCPVTLSKIFFLIFPFYIQTKNQNSIKHAKILGSPVRRYNVLHVGCQKKYLLSRGIGMLSFIVVGDMGYATCELFLSGSSIFRQMLDKWNVEQMGSRTSDMDPILIPAY